MRDHVRSVALAVFLAWCLSVKPDPMCPCKHSPDQIPNKPQSHEQHSLCIEDTEIGAKIFSSLSPRDLNLNYRLLLEDFDENLNNFSIQMPYGTADCDVIMKVIDRGPIKRMKNLGCPGICKTIPVIPIPSHFILSILNSTEASFPMCSLNLSTSRLPGMSADPKQSLGVVLRTIALRRLQECEEKKDPTQGTWLYVPQNKSDIVELAPVFDNSDQSILSNRIPRRKVYGVVVWIASLHRITIALNQVSGLLVQSRGLRDTQQIVSWLATEEIYPCNFGAPPCQPQASATKGNIYNNELPATIIHKKSTLPGWACAQRRPLRALSHMLSLYDPDFVLVADDDTFVNIKMLSYGSILSSYILRTMSAQPIVLGDLKQWHITSGGFYYGGGGYLMGRSVLTSLVSKTMESRVPSVKDKYRYYHQTKELGVLTEALAASKKKCPKCVRVRQTSDEDKKNTNVELVADLNVRVVDMCSNMMAYAGTCYHSDHSLPRCLAHAIYADTVSAGCYKNETGCDGIWISDGDGNSFRMAMSSSDSQDCDLSFKLTCHRRMTDPSDPHLPPVRSHDYCPKAIKAAAAIAAAGGGTGSAAAAGTGAAGAAGAAVAGTGTGAAVTVTAAENATAAAIAATAGAGTITAAVAAIATADNATVGAGAGAAAAAAAAGEGAENATTSAIAGAGTVTAAVAAIATAENATAGAGAAAAAENAIAATAIATAGAAIENATEQSHGQGHNNRHHNRNHIHSHSHSQSQSQSHTYRHRH